MVAKMNAKRFLVSFCMFAIAIFLVTTVSASEIANDIVIDVDDIEVHNNGNPTDNASVVAGETVKIEVFFTAERDDTDVRVRAEIEGQKIDVTALSKTFDVEAGKRYKKTLSLKVPFELRDELSDDVTLNVRISGEDHKTEVDDIDVRVQRPSYNPVVKSIGTPQSIDAGDTFPVDIVLRNLGYNELDDVYVTVTIPELGIQRTGYFGDIIELEDFCDSDDDDCDDTVNGRVFLEVPFEVESGIYNLEVEVTNDDVTSTVVRQISIDNDLSENVIVATQGQTVEVGEDAEYTLLLINPTNDLRVYKVIPESSNRVSSSAESTVVAVPAGSSKTVTITANAESAGEYNFDVSVLSGETLVDEVSLNLSVEDNNASSPIVVLTVVLAIIFLVLLVVLIVLIGKRPSKKQEEFGESYY